MRLNGEVARTMWQVARTEARGRRGAVAAKHDLAAGVGIDVLRDGGNAVDAAVAMAFTLSVVEPFMSGLGGGGFMALFDAARGTTTVVDFAMVSPHAATPDMFQLVPSGESVGMFGWPAVVNDANITGHRAVATPGAVAGLLLAHERHGSLPLARLMEPAIGFAEQGFEVDWFTSLVIGVSTTELQRFPSSASIFLPRGCPPLPFMGDPGDRLIQRDLAATLRAIAAGGAEAFYQGSFAEALHDEMARHDGLVTRDDLAAYQPRVHSPGLVGQYRGHTLVGVPVPSGSPTVLEYLALLERYDLGALGHNTTPALHLMASAGLRAFDDRFTHLADEHSEDAVARLLDPAYLDHVAASISPHGRATGSPVANALAQAPDARERTTTLAAADGAGNVVALTMTLLSGFGSAVTVPGTGVVLNNGMMWFDPRPGRPNSVGPFKRPLNNMSPLLVMRNGRPRLAVGAMGGRRILGAVTTIVSNVLDFGMGMQAACAAPRIDLSTGVVLADPRISPDVLDGLRARGHRVRESPDVFGSFEYGSPAAILLDDDGQMSTGVDPLNPAAGAAF